MDYPPINIRAWVFWAFWQDKRKIEKQQQKNEIYNRNADLPY